MPGYLALLCLLAGLSFGSVAAADTPSLAPGYGPLRYSLPAAGSYRLPPLGNAEDGEVLDTNGTRTTLYELFENKYVLLSII